jgi:rubrerythrin
VGEYLCCASASLSWRCADCGKVSEGFAFPYGLCPLCGGKLSATAPRAVEGTAALEAVRAAFEIELGGQAFYQRASRQTKDPLLGDLFGKFVGMEEEHMATLSRRYHVEVPKPGAGFSLDRAAIYAGIHAETVGPDKVAEPAELFRIAIAFEKRAAAFFGERGTLAPEGSVERTLYQELAAEEREHGALLETEQARWASDKPGLL